MRKPNLPEIKKSISIYLSDEAIKALKKLKKRFPGVSRSQLLSIATVEYEEKLNKENE